MSFTEAPTFTPVPIDPKAEISWSRREVSIDSSAGVLYTPPDSSLEQRAHVLEMFRNLHHIEQEQRALINADQDERDDTVPYPVIGRGRHGTVYDADPFALKAFLPRVHHGDLSEIRATLLLEEGLRRIEQPVHHYLFRGVKLLAAFTPIERDQVPRMWAMEKITPVSDSRVLIADHIKSFDRDPDDTRIPDDSVRINLYLQALELFQATGALKFDDKPDNLLVERTPHLASGVRGSIVKIDVQSRPGELMDY